MGGQHFTSFRDGLRKQPLLPVFACLVLGIWLDNRFAFAPIIIFAIFGTALLLSLVLAVTSRIRECEILVLGTFCLLGSLSFSLWRSSHFLPPLQNQLPLEDVTLSGRVVQVRQNPPNHFVMQISQIETSDTTLAVNLKVQVFWRLQETFPVAELQWVALHQVTLSRLPEPRNPGQFDYGRYLKYRGIMGIVQLDRPEQLVMRSGSSPSRWQHVIGKTRLWMGQTLDRWLPPHAAGFYRAILLGQREFLSARQVRDYQKAGVAHVLAISGLHVGFIGLIFYLLFSFLPIPFRMRNVLVMLALLFYMLLVGNKPPVVRATLMGCLLLLARCVERKHSGLNALFASGIILLLFAPQQLFWVGFQFSFAAVLAILLLYSPLENWMLRLLPHKLVHQPAHPVRRYVLAPLLVTVAAQLGTAPLTIWYFHQFPLVSFGLNLLVVPAMGLLVLLGMLILLLAPFWGWWAFVLGDLAGTLVTMLNWMVSQAANLPWAAIPANTDTLAALATLGGLAVVLLLPRLRFSVRLGLASALLMLGIQLQPRPPTGLELLLMDVGQGDALLLRTPAGATMLVDAGPRNRNFDAGQQVVVPVLKHLGIDRVQKLVISHPHMDHMGGAFSLLQHLRVDSLYLPPCPVWLPERAELLALCQKLGTGVRELRAGHQLHLDSQSRIYVLGPLPRFCDFEQADGTTLNNASLVLLFCWRTCRILLPGDAEQEAEQQLLGWGNFLHAEILKSPHHGSMTSSTLPFLQQVQPEIALISAGRKNRFGHPDSLTTLRLRKIARRVLRTDLSGAIWLRSTPEGWQQVIWKPEPAW